MSEIAQKQRARFVNETEINKIVESLGRVHAGANTYQRNITLNEITRTNLQKLEEICNQLATYLEQNEISNTEDLSNVKLTISEVFTQMKPIENSEI